MRSPSISPDDRLVIGQFSEVLAVSASARRVFLLARGGLAVYDRTFSRWEEPSAALERELTFAGVGASTVPVLAADPFEDAVWLAVPGAVLYVRTASLRSADVQRFTIAGVPEVIAFPRGDASRVLVRASGRWTELARTGFATPLIGAAPALSTLLLPVQLDDVYREHPTLRGQLPFVLRDATAASAPRAFAAVTAGTLSPDQPSEAWIGTRGDGLWRVDANFMRAEPLRYGVQDGDIGALAIASDGVWSAGQSGAERGGLSFVGASLQEYRWIASSAGTTVSDPLAYARAQRMVVRGATAWVATDRGLARVSLDGSTRDASRDHIWSVRDGLPDDRVLDVVPRSTGAWVGTARGLAYVDETDNQVTRQGLAGGPVRAVAVAEELLFAATDRGVFVRSANPAPDAEVIALPSAGSSVMGGVLALAWNDSVLLVVSGADARLVPRPRTIAEVEGAASRMRSAALEVFGRSELQQLGPIVAANVDDRSVWVVGERGVLSWTRDGGHSTRWLPAGGDLPPTFTALALDAQWAWLGSRTGLIRVARGRDGGLP